MSVDVRFTTFLRDRIGLDPASIGVEGVQRAVTLRAAEKTSGDIDHYWIELLRSQDERQALIEAVVVPETWFFRYPESIAFLVRRAAHWSAEIGPARPINIVTLPSSTGEEPYSIAMALLDAGYAPHQFNVLGLDISPAAITRAQQARYGKNSFRGEFFDFQSRHFTLQGNEYVLSDTVKACVSFRCENLFDLSAETVLQSFDIVFCRNLLIYFDVDTQVRALNVVARICAPDGDLFVGPAEASLLTRLGYKPIGTHQAFAFAATKLNIAANAASPSPSLSRSTSYSHAPAVRPAASLNLNSPLPTPARASSTKQAWALGGAATGRAPSAASSAMNTGSAARSPALESTELKSALEEIRRLADLGRVAEALALADTTLRTSPPDAELFYLVGLCLDAQGDVAQASVQYRKALYLAPNHIEALTHLAAVLDAQGDAPGAARLRMRAHREEAKNA